MDPSKRARTDSMNEDRHECPCKQKNRITCITLKNTDGVNTAGSVSRLVSPSNPPEANIPDSFYEFDVGTSFSVHRHKPCIIRVCAGSVGFQNDAAMYLVGSTAATTSTSQNSPIGIGNVSNPPGFIPIGTEFTVAGVGGGPYTTTALVSEFSNQLSFTPNLADQPLDGAVITFADQEVGVASIDILTNIEVQGLAKNMPNSPAGQVVQCEMDVAATNQMDVVSTNLSGIRIYHTTQPHMTRFRCQSLPDRIQLQMARVPATFNQTTNNFTLSAPDFISLTLEIEFDE